MFGWLELYRRLSVRQKGVLSASESVRADGDTRFPDLLDALGNRRFLGLLRRGRNLDEIPRTKREAASSEDPQEAQADAVAQSIGRINGPSSSSEPRVVDSSSATAGQRGTADSEQPLPKEERAYFERRFGQDLGDVHVHTDAASHSAAKAMRARAFTVGTDVSFARGEYAPGTARGHRLLAHELTHVVQQRASGRPRVQRATEEDFRIGGIFPGSANHPDTLFFDFASADLEPYGDEAWKLLTILHTRPSELTLYGFASEEGDPEFNQQLVRRRLNAVQHLLRSWPPDPTLGFRGPIHRRALPEARRGEIDYRRWRAVRVQMPGAEHPQPSCEDEPIERQCTAQLWTIHAESLDLIDNAIERLDPDTITTEDREILALLFGAATDPIEVIERLQWIRGHMEAEVIPIPRMTPGLPAARVVCATRCHPLCRAGYEAVSQGEGGESNIVICPALFESPRAASSLLHEATHATPGMRPSGSGTEDIAYAWERLITHIGRLGLENATSYELVVRMLSGESVTLGGGEPDLDEGNFTPPERLNEARRAMALAQNWAHAASTEINLAYGEMHQIIAGQFTEFSSSEREVVEWLDAYFGIARRPGEDPVTNPLEAHAWRLAGINDRYRTVRGAFRQRFTLGQMASGTIQSIQRPDGPVLRFGPAFFALSELDRVRELFSFIVSRMPELVSLGLRNAYVNFADDSRAARGFPP